MISCLSYCFLLPYFKKMWLSKDYGASYWESMKYHFVHLRSPEVYSPTGTSELMGAGFFDCGFKIFTKVDLEIFIFFLFFFFVFLPFSP